MSQVATPIAGEHRPVERERACELRPRPARSGSMSAIRRSPVRCFARPVAPDSGTTWRAVVSSQYACRARTARRAPSSRGRRSRKPPSVGPKPSSTTRRSAGRTRRARAASATQPLTRRQAASRAGVGSREPQTRPRARTSATRRAITVPSVTGAFTLCGCQRPCEFERAKVEVREQEREEEEHRRARPELRGDAQVARHHLRRLALDDRVVGRGLGELGHGVGLAGATTGRCAASSRRRRRRDTGRARRSGCGRSRAPGTGEGSCHSIDFEPHGFDAGRNAREHLRPDRSWR